MGEVARIIGDEGSLEMPTSVKRLLSIEAEAAADGDTGGELGRAGQGRFPPAAREGGETDRKGEVDRKGGCEAMRPVGEGDLNGWPEPSGRPVAEAEPPKSSRASALVPPRPSPPKPSPWGPGAWPIFSNR